MLQLSESMKRNKRLRWIWQQVRRHQQFTIALLMLLLVVLAHTIIFFLFEIKAKPKLTMFDSFWVTLTTITTVGYGDISASTVGGRLTTIILGYLVGLGLFAWVAGEFVSRLFERMLNRRRGMGKKSKLHDHYLLVHFPSEEKIRVLIERLRANEATALTPLVVIADNIEMLPFSYPDVHFVRGSSSNPDTYQRAGIHRAKKAIVMALDHEDPSSDAGTAAAVSIIEAMNQEIHTVAECVFEEHLMLFRHVSCDQILMAGDMLIRLLVQETQDVGAARAISQLLDPTGDEFYSIPVGPHAADHTFREVLWNMMTAEPQVLPVGSRRDGRVELNPPKDEKVLEDDELIVLCDDRPTWTALPKKYFASK